MKKTELLKHIQLFSDLSEDELEILSGATVERNYRRNMIIFMEGEPGDAVYYVRSGKVKVFRTYEDGREHIINIFGEGEIFGEATLFQDVAYPASASAYEDSVIGIIRNTDLQRLLRENPELSIKVIKLMSKKLVLAQQKIRDLTFNDVFSRTASQIFKLSADYGRATASGILVDVSLTRQELADMVGTTRETVSRVISRFKKEKSLSEENDRLIITNEGRLRAWI